MKSPGGWPQCASFWRKRWWARHPWRSSSTGPRFGEDNHERVGHSVGEAMRFLRGFFGDVSKLVSVVEGEMTGTGLASPWGSHRYVGPQHHYTPTPRDGCQTTSPDSTLRPHRKARSGNQSRLVYLLRCPLRTAAARRTYCHLGNRDAEHGAIRLDELGPASADQRGPKIPYSATCRRVDDSSRAGSRRARVALTGAGGGRPPRRDDGAAGRRSAPTRTRGEGPGGIAECVTGAAFEKMRCGAVCCTR